MAAKGFRLLNRLRKAIQKVKFLLSFDATRWIFSSVERSSPVSRRLSFKNQPGLLDCVDDNYNGMRSSFGESRTSSFKSAISRTASSASPISRTTSDASSADDIDRRAEAFIANFYRHIQMERQVSLELQYCKGRELERTRSD